MRLADLDPKLTATSLRFTCPQCGNHVIAIPLGPEKGWQCTGTIENATVTPSIAADSSPVCRWHGHVVNGEITFCADSWNKPVDPITGLSLE